MSLAFVCGASLVAQGLGSGSKSDGLVFFNVTWSGWGAVRYLRNVPRCRKVSSKAFSMVSVT